MPARFELDEDAAASQTGAHRGGRKNPATLDRFAYLPPREAAKKWEPVARRRSIVPVVLANPSPALAEVTPPSSTARAESPPEQASEPSPEDEADRLVELEPPSATNPWALAFEPRAVSREIGDPVDVVLVVPAGKEVESDTMNGAAEALEHALEISGAAKNARRAAAVRDLDDHQIVRRSHQVQADRIVVLRLFDVDDRMQAVATVYLPSTETVGAFVAYEGRAMDASIMVESGVSIEAATSMQEAVEESMGSTTGARPRPTASDYPDRTPRTDVREAELRRAQGLVGAGAALTGIGGAFAIGGLATHLSGDRDTGWIIALAGAPVLTLGVSLLAPGIVRYRRAEAELAATRRLHVVPAWVRGGATVQVGGRF